MIYDISFEDSFERMKRWLSHINEYDRRICKVLVGNKYYESERKITYEEGKQLANKYNINFFEVSDESEEGVNEVFNKLIEEILIYYKRIEPKPIKIFKDEANKKKCAIY